MHNSNIFSLLIWCSTFVHYFFVQQWNYLLSLLIVATARAAPLNDECTRCLEFLHHDNNITHNCNIRVCKTHIRGVWVWNYSICMSLLFILLCNLSIYACIVIIFLNCPWRTFHFLNIIHVSRLFITISSSSSSIFPFKSRKSRIFLISHLMNS